MKDEEMAEGYAEDFVKVKYGGSRWCKVVQKEKLFLKIGFKAGLKAGRPQWHDLRKDPNDLPKEDKYYLIVTKLDNFYISKFRGTCWIGKCNAYVSEDMVIAWCEIPTFDKE